MRSILTLILALLLPPSHNRATELGSAATELGSAEAGVFSNAELGFSFTPPPGLRDLTAGVKEIERRQTKDGRTHFSTLLWMASGPDDTAADWVSLRIETFPRGRDLDKSDDVTAGFFTNHAAAGGVMTERQVAKFSGQDFAMSRVERKVGTVTRYAVVYTTVRSEQFLTFIFVGNARDTVDKMAESMKTVRFVRQGAS